ncbi:MAG: acylneuraminate cytidylyltransferase [Chloroflexi bacterium]|nr:acylneuraminate cytidylyltransferase [Chloroflexota bacterium]
MHIDKQSVLAVVPARGGSKGIPQKNLACVAHVPLVVRSIQAAQASALVDRIVVSTDDPGIEKISREAGAEIVLRPQEISGDTATSESAILHCLAKLRASEGYVPDIIVFLQCTSPFTLAEDIDGTVNALRTEDAGSALAVTDFHYFLWRNTRESGATGVNHDKSVRQLRQHRQPEYLEAGSVYAMKTNAFLQEKHRFCGRTALYVMPSERVLEIDEPPDLLLARAVAEVWSEQDRLGRLPSPIQAFVTDFDGVVTDNRVILSESGDESVVCDRADGLGLSQLRETGLPILVLSSEKNAVVEERSRKLGLECISACENKLAALHQWAAGKHIDLAHVVYVGNDINDLACMTAVGCAVAVNDAYPQVKAVADWVLHRRGGHGALREIIDHVLETNRSCSNG